MPDLHGLTALQMSCMQIIQELTDASGGVPPSYDEIAREMGQASKGNTFRLVTCLVERGFITRLPHRRRTLAILYRVPMPDFTPLTFTLSPALVGQGVMHG